MSRDDAITIELDILETSFLVSLLQSFEQLEDEFPEVQRKVARGIRLKMIDTAVLEGKVGIDILPPREEDDDDGST